MEEVKNPEGRRIDATPAEWIFRYQIGERCVYECPHCGEYEFVRPYNWNGCPFCLGGIPRKELAE